VRVIDAAPLAEGGRRGSAIFDIFGNGKTAVK